MAGLFSDYEEARRSGLFDAEYYLATYPEVAERNIDPLVHYLEEGARTGRNPHPDFDAAYYLEQCRAQGEAPANPLLHYLRSGAARGLRRRRDAAPEARRPIRVAIEALGVTGRADGGVRLSVGGWALAAAPIVAITAALADTVLATAAYGLSRPDLYPDDPEAARCGFLLSLDLPPLRRAAVEPVLSVHTAAGEVGRRTLRVEIPPAELDVGVVDPRDAEGRGAADPGAAAMLLAIERAAVDAAGILRVEGWVVCRVQIERVEVFLDGEAVGEAALGRARDDIAGRHPDYPNARFSGFMLAADVAGRAAGRKRLAVKATARAGIVREAAAEVAVPALAAAPAPAAGVWCHCDAAALRADGQLTLRGWAVCPAPAAALLVLLDDREIGRAQLGLERPDVGNLFPGLVHARQSGFAFTARMADPAGGEHRLTLRLCLEDGVVHDETVALAAADSSDGDATTAADSQRILHLDAPQVIGGALAAPVRGNLEIGGWALAKAGVAAVEIAIDDAPFALAEYGLRRPDIGAAFPDWEGAAASGFAALLPHRILPKGGHRVTVALRDSAGATVSTAFRIEVEELGDMPGPWALRRSIGQAEIDLAGRLLERCGRRPRFAVLLPLPGDPQSLAGARATIAALMAQAYPEWRLLLVARGRRDKSAAATLSERDPRIAVTPRPTPQAVAELAAAAGAPAESLFLLPLVPGDDLGSDALLEMALAAALHPGADFLYSDERRRNPASGRIEAFFKPRWSPDLLLSTNYIGRLWCARGDLLAAVAAPDETLFGDGEYDLVLRCTEKAKAIHHVAAVLCERAGDDGDDAKRAKAALARAAVRRGIAATVVDGPVPGTWRLKRALTRPGLVSIVIPTCAAGGLVAACIESLRRLTAYRDYEIVCIENIAPADAKWRRWLARRADRVISTREDFNWARFNNLAANEARGEYLLFLNDDIEVTDPDWLQAMLEEAQRPEVGAVGARLLYPDGRVQHAGMFLAAMGQARHAFRYAAGDDPGYFGLALTRRDVIAVTGACLLTRRDTFEALGGFDEAQAIVNNDLDYCLRAWRSGRVNLYTPFAALTHHEAASRAALPDDYDALSFDRKWRDLFLAGDPYFSQHLSKGEDGFAVEQEPTQLLVTGRPLFRAADIRRILVVKLDHIGDCVIAFPAVRRLHEHFPAARIAVLTSRASQPIWALEPSVAETIAFDFFHARSGLGELDLSEEDWRQLRERLTPERFDLAVDLRKHTETRPVLQHTAARWLAGFDFRNQFPWLDIALEWTGDQAYVHKRQHNGDDLLNLADAVAAAGSGERTAIAARPAAAAAPPAAAGSGPLVCVHPTVGNDARQWPLEYFAVLIDRLVEADGARVVLIGAPGDEEAAAAILRQVRHPRAVTSLVGQVPLAELPSLLAGVALFVGNNSGPKHIAAGLGVPTVGIHSGTEDVREWGPIGAAAIAVARDMVCSPCYLAHAKDCRRGLACLTGLAPARVYEACRRLLPLAAPALPMPRPGNGEARPGGKGRAGRPPAPRAASGSP
jgi:ADP-heptose:LPS heptosyltransferase/GT2 family glycosyltransferase